MSCEAKNDCTKECSKNKTLILYILDDHLSSSITMKQSKQSKQSYIIENAEGLDSVACFRFFDINKMAEMFEAVSTFVEGKTNVPRVGHNFSMSKLLEYSRVNRTHNELHSSLTKKSNNINYIIAYLDGDILTKHHELQHARFYVDKLFRKRVEDAWSSLDAKKRLNIETFLTKLGYPEDVWIDEFQAYYLTEKPNFFGIRLDIDIY